MAKLPLATNLYTVRHLAKQDFASTVKRVAALGYPAVELAGFGSLSSAKDVRKALDDAGLATAASHSLIEVLEKDVNKALDENDALGNKNVVIPWIPEDRRTEAAGWKRVAQTINKIADACRARGFTLAYHNHAFEFDKFDGAYGLDILFEHLAPDVKLELDVFWVKFGGEDPVKYINKFGAGKRVPLLHLKDMSPGAERKFAEVGSGTLDFKGILAAGQKAGVQWYIVEQDDTYDIDPLESLRISLDNLKKLGAV